MQAKKTLTRDARRAAETCLGGQARLLARQITRHFDLALQPAGLSLAQFGLLCQIAGAQDDAIGALAQRLGLDPSTLSRNLQQLESRGWVEIASLEQDLRRRAVWLTEAGAHLLEQALPMWRAAQAGLAGRIGEDALAPLNAAVARPD